MCCSVSAQLSLPAFADGRSVCPRRHSTQCTSFKTGAKIELADGSAKFPLLWCHPEARQLLEEILPHAERVDTLHLLGGDLRGSVSPASAFTFHRVYGSGCALQQLFFYLSNSQPVWDHGWCSQEKARLQGKPPVLPSPTEVKAILLISERTDLFTSAEAPPGALQPGLAMPCVPNLSGQASFRGIVFFQAQYWKQQENNCLIV